MPIESLKHNKNPDHLGQEAWQNGSALAARTPGRATVNKRRLYSPLLRIGKQMKGSIDLTNTFDFKSQPYNSVFFIVKKDHQEGHHD